MHRPPDEFPQEIDWAAGKYVPKTVAYGPAWTDVAMIPPAPADQACRICGARRKREETDDEWVADVVRTLDQGQVRRIRGDDGRTVGAEADEPAWSRRHVACIPTAAWVVVAVTGAVLQEDDANAVLAVLEGGVTAQHVGRASRKPWGHLDRRDVERLEEAVVAVVQGPQPAPCVDGRCGVCGRSSSTAWERAPGLSWEHGGRPAPVCADCIDLVPLSLDLDLLRIRALAVVADVEPGMSLRVFPFRLAADVLTVDEQQERGIEPWAYRPAALAEMRRSVRELRPGLIRDDFQRAVAVKVHATRLARLAQQTADEEAAAAPGGLAVW